jgi:hypothetical protein
LVPFALWANVTELKIEPSDMGVSKITTGAILSRCSPQN